MKAKTIRGNNLERIIKELDKVFTSGYSIDQLPFIPNLAIVFISISQDRKSLCKYLTSKGVDVFGATSSGEFTEENESQQGIAILLLDINPDFYKIVFEDIGERSLDAVTNSINEKAKQYFDHPALILCSTLLTSDGKMLNGEIIIENLEKEMGEDVILFGGLAGDDFTFTGTFVFTNSQETDYGMVCLVLDQEKVGLYGMAISGWKPMGISRKITKSEGNLVFTIDNQPALDIYMKYLGEKIDEEEDQINFFETLGIYYPFQIERENRDPKMCNPMGYDKERSALICESNVIEGSRFRFSAPPDFDIVDTVVSKAKLLKDKLNTNADALLIFSCAGRLSALGPMAQQENEGLFEVWNAPMAGFYTYGEFGKGESGKHEIHSTTNSWVALKEK